MKAPKICAILDGGDWSDASVDYIVLLKEDRSLQELYEVYNLLGGFEMLERFFSQWLLFMNYAREATDKDIQVLVEN